MIKMQSPRSINSNPGLELGDRWIKNKNISSNRAIDNSKRLLFLFYLKDKMLVIQRVIKETEKIIRKKKLVYYLTNKSGKIAVASLMAVLGLKENSAFSLNDLKEAIDQEYFLPYSDNISISEINASIKRTFQSTLSDFIEIDARCIKRHGFSLDLNFLRPIHDNMEEYAYYRQIIDVTTENSINNTMRRIQ